MALIGNDQQVGLGSLLRRFVPDRGRRYLQAALLMGALVTVVALPMIYLRGANRPSRLSCYGTTGST